MPALSIRECEIGRSLRPLSRQFSVDMFKLGDVKTLHNDQAAAELEGLPRPIAVAPQVSALIFRMMREAFGHGWIVGGKGSLTFRRPVWSDDRATAHGVIAHVEDEADARRVHCEVWVERTDGERAIVGRCSALVPDVP